MKHPLIYIISAALAFTTAGHCAPPPPLNVSNAFGANLRLDQLKRGDMARIKAAGFTWVRFDMRWPDIEKKPGVYDFGYYDNTVAGVTGARMRAIVVLGGKNPLYNNTGDASSYDTPQFRNAYAAFCAATIAHFSGKGFLWEMWNEPNDKGSWPLPTGQFGPYIAMVKQASMEVRKDSPQEMIVGPACSTIDLKLIDACLDAGMLDYWSAITCHPYRQAPPETISIDYAYLRKHLAKFNTDIPIVCGEWGYSTAWRGMNDTIQSDYLRRMVLIERKEGIPLSIFYDWRDDGDDALNGEHRFGLVRRNAEGKFVPKPSYWSLKSVLLAKADETVTRDPVSQQQVGKQPLAKAPAAKP